MQKFGFGVIVNSISKHLQQWLPLMGISKWKPIVAGKLRRYFNMPLWQQLIRFRTIMLPNIVDSGKLLVGTVQSMAKLLILAP